MRLRGTSEPDLWRLLCGAAVLFALVLTLGLPAFGAEQPPPGAPAEGEHPLPGIILNDKVLHVLGRHRPTQDLEDGMVPGLATADRVWQSLPAGVSFFDPSKGAIYYPGMSLVQLRIVDAATGTPIVLYYAVPISLLTSDPTYYQVLMTRAMADAARAAQAQKTAAEAAGKAAAQVEQPTPVAAQPAAAPQPPPRLASRLAPMLGGPGDAPLRFVVGEVRLRQGRPAEALQAFEQSAVAFGQDPTPLLARAIALIADGQSATAAGLIRQGLGALGDWHSLHVDWPVVFGSQETAQSLEGRLTEAAGANSADEDALLVLAFYCFAARRDEMVTQLLQGEAGAKDSVLRNLRAAAQHRPNAAEGPQAAP